MTVMAFDPPSILIWMFNVFFFYPEEFFAFGTFSDKHGHKRFLINLVFINILV